MTLALKPPTTPLCQATAGVQHNSRAATPPGSPAPAATEIPPRHRPLALVAFVDGKPQTRERFGGAAGAAILFALLAHKQQYPRAPRLVVDIALAGEGCGGGGALAFPVEQRWAEGQVAVAGGGGEEGFAFAQGDEQEVGGAGLVLEHALAVDPGGFGAEHAVAAGFCVGAAFSKRSNRPLRFRRVCSGRARAGAPAAARAAGGGGVGVA